MLQNTIKYTIEKELVPETELVRAEFMEHTVGKLRLQPCTTEGCAEVKNETLHRMIKILIVNNIKLLSHIRLYNEILRALVRGAKPLNN